MEVRNVLLMDDDFFKKLNECIVVNIDNPDYTVDHLCKDCLISRSQLHRKIKEETDLSTSIYIRNVKLFKAKELLINSNLNISEIAYATGFSSPQTLSRYFSATFGKSPSQFKSDLSLNSDLETLNPESENDSNVEAGNQQSDRIDSMGKFRSTDKEKSETKIEVKFPSKQAKQPSRKHLSRWFLIAIPLFLFTSIWVYQRYISDKSGGSHEMAVSPTNFKNSIAVLPFLNMGAEETRKFSIGIQDDILTKLSFFKELKVISRTSTEQYKDTKKMIKQIGRELGVDYLLEGSVRIYDNQVSVTTQLIRTSDDFHVWAENYVEDMDDIFKIQNEISLEIAKQLNQKITDETTAQIDNIYQPSKAAYKDYLIGKELLKERTHSALQASIKRFDQALTLEPEFIDAVVQKSIAYQLLGNIGYDRNNEHTINSEKFALQALGMDSKNAMAYAILACNYRDAYQWEQAKITFEIALEHSPNNPIINYWYSLMLREIGDMERSVMYSSKARELDPLYPVIHGGHIVNLAYADKKNQAESAIKEGDVLFKQSFMHYWAKAIYEESIFDYQAAMKAFEKVLEINPELSSADRGILFNKARLGEIDEVKSVINNIQTNTAEDLLTKATLYLGLKDADQATDYILKAMDQGIFPSDILVDKNYDFLRKHSNYPKILAQYNLLSYANQNGLTIESEKLEEDGLLTKQNTKTTLQK